jgi:hypothetical protein
MHALDDLLVLLNLQQACHAMRQFAARHDRPSLAGLALFFPCCIIRAKIK